MSTTSAAITDQSGRAGRIIGEWVGYTVLIATLLMLVFFLVLPITYITLQAFKTDDGFGLQYFSLLFANDLYTSSIYNSVAIGLVTTILCTVLSLPLAMINARCQFRGKALLSGLLLVPMIMPPFVGAIGFQRLFARMGSVNMWLMDVGLISQPIDWLAPEGIFWVVVILECLHLYPIMYLNLTAALANIDPSVEEMAETMGVKGFRRFKDIVWPLARPGYFAGAIIVFIWALTDLGTPLLVGFHDTLPVKIFHMVTDANENPIGYALVCVVILMTVAFFALSKLWVNPGKYSMMAKGHVTDRATPLGPIGTAATWLLFLSVIAVAMVPHLSVIVTSLSHKWFMTPLPKEWTLEHYSAIFGTDLSLLGIKNSFYFATWATLLDLVLGLLIAYVVVRKLIPFAGFVDALAMLPLALPGIVLAFGYVVTYSGTFLDPMVNPVVLIVIAYAIRRLPFMVRSASAGLQQSHAALEEASSVFGASRLHTMRKITFPLVMANLIAGGLLTFAYAMLDVSDSLILAMKDRFYPLTKAIYALFLEQGNGEFLASALGVVGMAILAVCIITASVLMGQKMGELFRS